MTESVKSSLRGFVLEIVHSKDAPRSGEPVVVDSYQIKALLENNQRYATREIANIRRNIKIKHRKSFAILVYISRFDVLLPHNLKGKTC